jgi:hypothetical protein
MPGWQARNTGLSATQMQMLCGITDPWWRNRNGGDPEACIFLTGHPGGMVRSTDSGKTWNDITPQTDPDNDWSDDPAPTATDLDYVALHGDIHNEGTFYALAEWQNDSDEWRGWILKTQDDGKHWTWGSSLQSYVGGNLVTNGTFDSDCSGWSPCGSHGVDWNSAHGGSCRMWFRALSDTYTGQTITIPTTGTYRLSATFYRNPAYTSPAQVRIPVANLRLSWANPEEGTKSADVSLSAGGKVLQIEATFFGSNILYGYFDDISLTLLNATSSEVRPLGIEVDSQDSSRIYVTVWDGTNLQLRVFNADMENQRSYGLGAASAAEVAAKTYYAMPFSPHLPGNADFGDYIFVYGRMAGSITHVAKSIDAGVSFSDVGNPAWDGASRVTRFGAGQYGSPDELRAFLTSPDEFWHAMGSNWQKQADLASEVLDASRGPETTTHPYVVAIKNEGIFYSDDPYQQWGKLDDQPPTPTSDGAIVWIV